MLVGSEFSQPAINEDAQIIGGGRMSQNLVARVLQVASIALAFLIFIGPAHAESLDVGTWNGDGCCGTATRGYWFEAPVDFNIDRLYMGAEGGPGTTFEIVRLGSQPPTFGSGTTNDFTSLGFWEVDGSSVDVSVAIHAGDLVGILGHYGQAPYTPYTHHVGSYGTAIFGDPVTLFNLGMQYVGPARELWTSSVTATGAIGLDYSVAAVPEPESWALLLGGLGLLGLISRRRGRVDAGRVAA